MQPGKRPAHTPPAAASQWVSWMRQIRPRMHASCMAARLAVLTSECGSTSQRAFQDESRGASARPSANARSAAAARSPSVTPQQTSPQVTGRLTGPCRQGAVHVSGSPEGRTIVRTTWARRPGVLGAHRVPMPRRPEASAARQRPHLGSLARGSGSSLGGRPRASQRDVAAVGSPMGLTGFRGPQPLTLHRNPNRLHSSPNAPAALVPMGPGRPQRDRPRAEKGGGR